MNRGHKAARLLLHNPALLAEILLGWLVQRFTPSPRGSIVKEERGVKFIFDFEHGPQMQQMYFSLYEPLTVAAMRRFLSKGDTFLDIGASVGYLSWIAAGLVGQRGQVHCFEPNVQDFQKLEEFRLANPERRIFSNPYALGEARGVADMDVSGLDWVGWNTLVPNFMRKSAYKETIQVEVRTLDDYIAERFETIGRITTIKIDTEGYEFFVLKGMRSFFGDADHRPAVICEVAPRANGLMGITMEDLSHLMARYGYKAYSLLDYRTEIDLTGLKEQTDVIFLCRR